MKLASIDVGTNSVRLLITEYKNNKFMTVKRCMQITRIGENLEKTGKISVNSTRKTLEVLSRFNHLIKEESVERIRAVGTRALRQASNNDWFLSDIYKKLGINIEIISGEEEAKLSLYGVIRELGINLIRSTISEDSKNSIDKNKNILVIDIGGGSTEFILSTLKGQIISIESLNIGCVNLTEKFIGPDKPELDKLHNMEIFIRNKIKDVIEKIKENKFLFIIGLAGTVTTIAAIDLKLVKYDRDKIHYHVLSLKKINQIYANLCDLDLEERKDVVGLEPERADIIIGGISILLEIMESSGGKIIVSENDILDGIIYTMVDFC
ncbi:MAG: Ppx/GppA family phosphatase [Actinobacteria bacterium]|nr:Ppx/GppA family phosphatase [Actinomycetota bacterium]